MNTVVIFRYDYLNPLPFSNTYLSLHWSRKRGKQEWEVNAASYKLRARRSMNTIRVWGYGESGKPVLPLPSPFCIHPELAVRISWAKPKAIYLHFMLQTTYRNDFGLVSKFSSCLEVAMVGWGWNGNGVMGIGISKSSNSVASPQSNTPKRLSRTRTNLFWIIAAFPLTLFS